MYNFAGVLEHNLGRYPDKVVLSQGERGLTNRELAARVHALAAGLRELGIGRGDIVALLLYNHIEFIETVLALNHLGAAFLPLNYRLSPAEWDYIIGNAEAAALLTEPEFADAAAAVPVRDRLLLGGQREGWSSYEDLVARHLGEVVPIEDVGPDTLQRLMYTSGTTSRPKGVCVTHGNLLYKNLGQIVEFGITSADTTLVCGPLYHVGGLDLPALATLHAGGSLILTRKFDAAEVVDTIERERPTNIWLAPSMMNALLHLPGLSERDTSSIRFVIGGGEKMPVPLIERIRAAFPSAWFADAYGLTETVSGDTFNDAAHMLSKAGSVGRPVVHLRVRVVDETGREVPRGELGEITLSGPKVFAGYWRDPEATAKALRDGWFHTGDIGRVDQDGYLYVEDRKKDMIVSGGENIATPEVERVLYEHPEVVEAAVVGMSHERWGEVPKAFVVLRPGAAVDAAGLVAFCRERLAKFKVPAEIQFLDELPRTPSGKVLKRDLRSLPVIA
ncbi:acyl-CoA synthetase (AMP-forming)/AMP-acid ligase II [Amycolatopsis bartoniae]|uniref:Fatty-acyl-CoA synthase n=1 Tax=Amycolatopsis bartoniae TaxID=941986 RepID=A0A8H9J0P0_9PSEU|nr:long-chain fatty acid--CoA ligase [Amycolatopsis bartoniae]MBB2938585.1 acyl-CoA synthetase (AMP-forming)/AMP-acid ligase II [Amycolatopsis bartoniae]TVT08912.1 long-chain fatty acid--CoA ligase [Amycolatopsis bartoniae]GHF69945.1 fatty-acyl-CoA synthase [Amycolatopsis bartoniae]